MYLYIYIHILRLPFGRRGKKASTAAADAGRTHAQFAQFAQTCTALRDLLSVTQICADLHRLAQMCQI